MIGRLLNSSAWCFPALVAFTLLMHAAPALAAGEAIVTELRGAVVKVTPKASVALREWDAVKEGDRISVPAGAHVSIFFSPTATLYDLGQPIEVVVKGGALKATSGTLPAPRNLHAAYRKLKIDSSELVQGSLVMRSGETVKLLGPEGIVTPEEARRFQWAPTNDGFRLELAASSGEPVLAREVKGGALDLPGDVSLKARTTYVWGLSPPVPGSKPTEWTEFRLADPNDKRPQPPRPTAADPRSEWLLYAAWLRSRGLHRAALRLAANAPAGR
jgi:hypothetical protein